mmetsp:Transcript_116934/g.325911  ORF Transcript_116934/g.325911 Transcript_116934/m.325911 type:complete len:90 (+) Transcript_116934:963-1232(+)
MGTRAVVQVQMVGPDFSSRPLGGIEGAVRSAQGTVARTIEETAGAAEGGAEEADQDCIRAWLKQPAGTSRATLSAQHMRRRTFGIFSFP